MKAEELMIGDWVLCDMYNPCDPYYPPGTMGVFQMRPEDYTNGLAEKYKPVPLTPEILEKNGFDPNGIPEEVMPIEERDYSDDTYVWSNASNECDTHCQVCVYIDYHNNVCLFEAFTSDSHIDGIKIRYVHQLQHALRLCGINKEIKL